MKSKFLLLLKYDQILIKPISKTLLFLIAFIFFFLDINAQSFDFPFKNGEKLQYRVSYNWEFVWVDAGQVSFTVDSINYNGSPAYHFNSLGKSMAAYDWIYKVRDHFESVADARTLRPAWYERKTSEGNYWVNNRLDFDTLNGWIVSKTENAYRPESVDTLALQPNVFDLLTAVYYARSLNFSVMKPGQKIPVEVIIDGKIHDLYGKYLGFETVENYDGVINLCHKFSVMLVAGTIFSEGEEALIWVTADRNKVPVLVEAKILVGSVKAYFVKADNLKYP